MESLSLWEVQQGLKSITFLESAVFGSNHSPATISWTGYFPSQSSSCCIYKQIPNAD